MATESYYRCEPCGEESPAREPLFDTLLTFSNCPSGPECTACERERELRVAFSFGLGAGRQRFRVLRAFLPSRPESWTHPNGQRVTFYPFLVVLQRVDKEGVAPLSFWLPYWHVHGVKKKIRSMGTFRG